MKKLILILIMLLPINACNTDIAKDSIDVAEYICDQTGEELFQISNPPLGELRFRCGGIESEWLFVDEAIKQYGTTCILENQ